VRLHTFHPLIGDGTTKCGRSINIELYPEAEIDVFDRNGRLVSHVKGYQNDWQGHMAENTLPMDTYYYVIDFHSDEV